MSGRFIFELTETIEINFSRANRSFIFTGKRGLIRKEIYRLPLISGNDECSICFDEKRAFFRILPCSHAFHQRCIDKWLFQAGTCPLCRHSAKI